MSFFKVINQSKSSKARLGKITTSHGVINTPSFVAVGTKGTIKALTPGLVKDIGTQVAFVNTYHLVAHPGSELIRKAGGIHRYSGLNMPLMSDSGGFQVFSLARGERTLQRNFYRNTCQSEKIAFASSSTKSKNANIRGEEEPFLVKISEDGVKFRSTFDGRLIEFTPEKSMEYQYQIGADINMAFDECIAYGVDYQYAKKATERTHKWLKRCINFKARRPKFFDGNQQTAKNLSSSLNSSQQSLNISSQFLYGVIQGGVFEDLRKKSAEFVVSQKTDGVAIGGVSVGETKKEMRDQVKWVSDYLPSDRPVHLLGVGQIDDIIDLVKYGIDTFDCVEPTRLARMGEIYKARRPKFFDGNQQTAKNLSSSLLENIDITKSIYKNNFEKLDVNCDCYVCQNFTKSYLHHLFKQRELLGYTLATYHNLYLMEKFFEKIRELIANNLL